MTGEHAMNARRSRVGKAPDVRHVRALPCRTAVY